MDDIADTLAPVSEQLDAIELIDGPRIFTVKSVTVRKADKQPVKIYFEEFPRPWRPGVNQRRVLKHCWGRKSSEWTGRKIKLFYEPDVTYGGTKTGGTRIAAMSHIDGPMDAPILISGGRASTYHVVPLDVASPTSATLTADQIARCTDADQLRAWWHEYPSMRAQITARGNELQEAPDGALIPPHEGDEP